MGLIEVNRNPTTGDLNWFGVIFAVFFGLVGLGVALKASVTTAQIIWGAAALIVAVYSVVPPVRRPLYVAWMYAFMPIGWVVTHTLLALVYYMVLTPIGLIRRLLGADPLKRRFDPAASTYWVEHRPGRDRSRYFRQF
jgi:hypothetical protein